LGVIAEPGEVPERIEGIQAGEVEERKPAAAAAAQKAEAEKPVQRGEILATPAAKRLAKELGIDLALVKGTGPDGRIKEADVTLYQEQALRKPKKLQSRLA
jgi:pyruvate dehydrogenase E2 component (dihydrolipoamide acetyltransferase)